MNNWNSIKDFFDELNRTEYLILRGHERLWEEIESGGDIDILCADKDYLVKQIHALPRVKSDKVYNYYVSVADKRIPIDIREIGDGYYDEKWERAMLDSRVRTEDYYIQEIENYRYSLLYHVLVHKFCIAEKHKKVLESMFKIKIKNNEKTYELLCGYLYRMGYTISFPMDKGVEFNNSNYKKLIRKIAVKDFEIK